MNRSSFLFLQSFFVIMLLYGCCTEKKPRVSIITSLYKGAPYIAQFMEDITKQTIFSDCQLIIINAASPDRAIEDQVIAPYLQQYANIDYIHLTKDPGLYGVWNMAITQYAKGNYLVNANVDDFLRSDAIELMAKALDEHPNVDLVWAECFLTYQPHEDWAACNARNCQWWTSAEFSFAALAKTHLVGNHPMWRKSAHQKAGYFDTSYKIAGDWDMWCRMALAGSKFKKIPGNLGVFYMNPKGLSWWVPGAPVIAEAESVKAKYVPLLLASHRKMLAQNA